jgi:hypothetical protein
METRRQVLTLVAVIPLFMRDVLAQDREMISALFRSATEYLNTPQRVRQKYQNLSYYLELLRRFPPRVSTFKPEEHLPDAVRSFTLIGEAIQRNAANFDNQAAVSLLPRMIDAYAQFQPTLWEYLKQIGIEPKLPANVILEEAIASMLLFYGAANKVTDVFQMRICIFPFCFGRPA